PLRGAVLALQFTNRTLLVGSLQVTRRGVTSQAKNDLSNGLFARSAHWKPAPGLARWEASSTARKSTSAPVFGRPARVYPGAKRSSPRARVTRGPFGARPRRVPGRTGIYSRIEVERRRVELPTSSLRTKRSTN